MNAEEFKKSYMKWSHAVAFCIPTLLIAIVLCDYLLEFDFSQQFNNIDGVVINTINH